MLSGPELGSVWAPEASSVALELEGSVLSLVFGEDGWWRAPEGTLRPGASYGFRLNGGAALPDPRSPEQPDGVHGLSRHVDHGLFPWPETQWKPPALVDAVIYELHIGTFSPAGTFLGAIARLPHLKALGITHLELMPVAAFSGQRGWGYDGVALFAPHPAYGGPEELKSLVDACHRLGLAIVLDVVYNHLGPGNYLAKYGPYFSHAVKTPWGPAVNLEGAHSDEVRRFFIDNALMWLKEYHFDGLRLDAVDAFLDRSAVHFLEELSTCVAELAVELGRELVLIAESDLNDPRVLHPGARGGYNIPYQWSDDLHHALHAFLTGERAGYYGDYGTIRHLAVALKEGFVLQGQFSRFRQRRHGRPPVDIRKNQLLGYLQTHDQVGNRPDGKRIGQLLSLEQLKLASALIFCCPFVPMLFQGEEWNANTPFFYFTDHDSERLGTAIRRGRRRELKEFGWPRVDDPDPQARETSQRSSLNWGELNQSSHQAWLAWYQMLIRTRATTPELKSPIDHVDFTPEASWLVLHRAETVAIFNFDAAPIAHPVDIRQGERLMGFSPSDPSFSSSSEFPGHSFLVLRKDPEKTDTET